jgi:hypothetical protein
MRAVGRSVGRGHTKSGAHTISNARKHEDTTQKTHEERMAQ